MKRQVSPAVAIVAVIIIVALVALVYWYGTGSRHTSAAEVKQASKSRQAAKRGRFGYGPAGKREAAPVAGEGETAPGTQ